MNGHILPGLPIAVDFWLTRGRQSHIHFLSHIHGDHIVGLTSTWMQPIYCSALTAEILHIYYGISKLLLRPVPLNQPVTIHSPYSNETFSVTAFDANHCPGALMFFFQGDFGNVFYTGDFRYSSDVMSSLLQPLQGKIGTLYMDNTFCSPLCNFPSRQECLARIIDLVKQHRDYDIVIGVRKLGKEDLLVKLGLAVDETIYTSPKQLSVIQHLYSTNIFASMSDAKDQHCRIRTVPFHQVSSSFIHKLNEVTPTIAILPSAVFSGLTPKPFSKNPYVHAIPYSDHSSFQELMEFVSQLKPSHIVPIVNSKRGPFGVDISDRQDMSCFKPFLNPVSSGQNRSYGVNCIGPKNFNRDVTRLETTSLADFSSGSDKDADSCSFSPNYLSDTSLQLNSSIACSSNYHLKRKMSGSSFKKRKTARGVCYVDDDPPKLQNNNNTFGLHDYEGTIEESVPSKCHVAASTRALFGNENNEEGSFIQNVSSSSDNEEIENADNSFKLQKHHKLYVKEKTIESNVENDHHSSFSYSQNRKTCVNLEEDGRQLEHAEAKICNSSLTNSKKLQHHNVAKLNSNFPDAFHATRESLDQNIDILKALRENNCKKQETVHITNKSLIACLKSVIKRWETN